jgi:hypothetical protein
VVHQAAGADVERLVVDQQTDELAGGDVDDRLARLGIPVAALRVRQRMLLVEPAQERPRLGAGLAFVEVPAQADVAIRQREQRLCLAQALQVEPRLAHRPRLDRQGRRAPAVHRALAPGDPGYRIGRPPVTATRAAEM